MAGHERREAPFVIRGTLTELETERPLPDLVVRAFDRDLVRDDRLGGATSDADGAFEIRFVRSDFQDLFERRPDLYLRVYDAQGLDVLHETTDAIRWNAGHEERFELRIPARALDPRHR